MAATMTAPHGTLRDPASQGYLILRITFVVVALLSGLDKFFTSSSSGRSTSHPG
jgi:uncharacterized membrane protein YphA (DoxX/SURF4 family)